ncbi:TPA: GHKL domain-containing protein [Streptococcus equi subsp. zooepidemicus]|uniref:Two-component regulatory system, sensor kinase protein n=1 Tax=Streptococcus equi subsp. zooepidemicus TaxID=40041 RepID=A0AAX2LF47_STRSZ|nr:GHKL domain-containing protein [Streptococcus equi]MCD3407509.1 GHKL domain-containing protein [Streptococcus equi subsp. zooepidemicus]MDI5900831.1 GHKL domain-containing protein [Streptococcus equi subsp. zooepidemicus]MDI5946951.1 GHKL domain-containing protein [Streptococcus equi subsp. zooepidemicus]MDI5958472.1 GHKL domain-containing protein [Streptococcus equi subsp. zooepidemicus]MDI5960550.1 GHKL domain-containing protein [Streptococcus equi subsp. zooepidemicus]
MVINAIFHLYTSVVNIVIVNYFFRQKNGQLATFKNIGYLSFLVFIECCTHFFVSGSYASLITLTCSLLTSLIISSSYRYSMKQCIFWSVTLQSIGILLEASLGIVLISLNYQISSISGTFLFINLLTISSSILIFVLKQLFLKTTDNWLDEQTQTNWILKLSIIPMISLSLLLLQLLRLKEEPLFDLFTILLTLGFIIITITSLYLYTYISEQHLQMQDINLDRVRFQSELKHLENVKENQLSIRALKHDLHNQNIVLLGLLEQKQYTKAQQLLNHNLNLLDGTDTFFTNDTILNYLLNQKAVVAKKNGIVLDIHCLIPTNISLKTEVISVIIGNLLDNSIAATIRNQNKAEKQIQLKVRLFKNQLHIDIENFFDPKELASRSQRKKDGLGIKNVQKIVQQYYGLYQQTIDNNIYKVSIIFSNIVLVSQQ